MPAQIMAVARTPKWIYLARFVFGLPMTGDWVTDRDWLHDGRDAVRPGRAYRWHYPAGWKVMLARWAAVAIPAPLAVYALLHPWLALLALLLIVSGPATWQGIKLRRWWRMRAHLRAWVLPLYSSLAHLTGWGSLTPHKQWLDVPAGFQTPENLSRPITVRVHPSVAGDAELRKRISVTVTTRLGLDDWRMIGHLAGADPRLTFEPMPRPPSKVPMDMVAELVANATDAAPLLGLGVGHAPIFFDLDQDSPHAGLSMGSGAGKSVLVRGLVAQWLAKGCRVLICDGKDSSQHWASDLPGVIYARTGQEMTEAIASVAAEYDRRSDLVVAQPADIDIDTLDMSFVGPRTIVVVEELNIAQRRMQRHWNAIREKSDPKRPPVYLDLEKLLCGGRFVRMHVVAIAQSLTADAIGGPTARENLGVRCLGRYSLNNWKMLVGQIPYRSTPRKVRGRIQVCIGDEARECQPVYMTTGQARDLALSWTGSGQPDPYDLLPGDPRTDKAYLAREKASVVPSDAPVAPEPTHTDRCAVQPAGTKSPEAPVSLREALEGGMLGNRSLPAVQRASQREGFPARAGTGPRNTGLYWPHQLAEWAGQQDIADTVRQMDREDA